MKMKTENALLLIILIICIVGFLYLSLEDSQQPVSPTPIVIQYPAKDADSVGQFRKVFLSEKDSIQWLKNHGYQVVKLQMDIR